MENKEQQPSTRRYAPDVPYVFPKDAKEIERLDYQHYVLRLLLNGNIVAPIEQKHVQRILDVGCGTGRWCREVAEAFPHVNVLGIDIEEHVPAIAMPTNFRFVKSNLLQGLPFADNTIDYTHQRLLIGAIPAAQWSFVVGELTRVTRPGGWIELIEGTALYKHIGPSMQQLLSWADAAAKKTGFDSSLILKLAERLKQAGLHEVTAYTVEAPLGPWGGRQGRLMGLDMQYICESLKGFYCGVLHLDEAAYDSVLRALPAEWEQYKTLYSFYVVYGKKR
jgi:ubiquinone/menaquinone biosynthesis C-methylase UbiE